ncbi:MAG: Hpt domain-containing protein, partial [Desulfosarcinaceae bacterium]
NQECAGGDHPAEPAENDKPLDMDTAVYEFGDLDTVRQVVAQLLDSAAAQIDEIRRAMSDKDLHAMKQNAHALKGSAATVEAGPLAAAAAAVEDMCQDGPCPEVAPAVAQLQTRFDQLKQYIQGLDWA